MLILQFLYQYGTFFVNIVNILQFLYQYGGDRDIIDFFDDTVLNYVIYELYFQDKMKEEGCYYGLFDEINKKVEKIELEKWIKLYFKSSLEKDELEEKIKIEKENMKLIMETYNNLNIESVNNKIIKMKDFDYIKIIEKENE